MIPVRKSWTNIVMGEGQSHVLPCPAHRNPDNGDIIVAFELTDEEIEAIKKHKTIMYMQTTYGKPMHPMQLYVLDENDRAIKDERIDPVSNTKTA